MPNKRIYDTNTFQTHVRLHFEVYKLRRYELSIDLLFLPIFILISKRSAFSIAKDTQQTIYPSIGLQHSLTEDFQHRNGGLTHKQITFT